MSHPQARIDHRLAHLPRLSPAALPPDDQVRTRRHHPRMAGPAACIAMLAMLLVPALPASEQLYIKGKALLIGSEAEGKMTNSVFTTLADKIAVSMGNFSGGPHVTYTSSTSYPATPKNTHSVIVEFIDQPVTDPDDAGTMGETYIGSGRAVVFANRVSAFIRQHGVRAVDAFHAISMHELGHAIGIADHPTNLADDFFMRSPPVVSVASRWRPGDQDLIKTWFKGTSTGIGGGGSDPDETADGSGLARPTSPITTVIPPPSWRITEIAGDAIDLLHARDGTTLPLAAGEKRWFRVRNPYGSVPDGDPAIYGPAPVTLRIQTQAWYYGGGMDTVLEVYVVRSDGDYQRIYGPAWDDRAWDDRFSQVDVTLEPHQEVCIGVYEYHGHAAEPFELLVHPLDDPAPSPSHVTVSPIGISGDWTGDVAEGETRHLAFRIPQSGQWEIRTEPTGGSAAGDDTMLTLHTVVGTGPQQLHAGTNDDLAPGTLWSAVAGDWKAGSWVIVQLSGYAGRSVRSVRLRAIPIGSSG